MPNRVLKDTIRTSRNVNDLTDFQFRVWVYLITFVDDYGRGNADPELLKGLCFPRRKGVTEKQIADAIHELANKGMINLYEVDGESYLYFPKWSDHQRVREAKPKYPEPPENYNSPQLAATRRNSPPESNPIQSESNPNPESESNPYKGLSPELSTAVKDFANMRKKIKKPLTDNAFNRLLTRLKNLASDEETQIKILRQSEYHCWQDVYELKDGEEPFADNSDLDGVF